MKNIKFGTAGWSYKDWEGIVYDRKEHGLEMLSSFLDCVEINNTFYRIPDERMVTEWAERVRERKDFTFLIKLWKGFTHEETWGMNSSLYICAASSKMKTGLEQHLLSFRFISREMTGTRKKLRELPRHSGITMFFLNSGMSHGWKKNSSPG